MKNKFSVPYRLSYDTNTVFWEVLARSKKEAREIAVKELASDQDVTHVGGVNYIIDLVKAERVN